MRSWIKGLFLALAVVAGAPQCALAADGGPTVTLSTTATSPVSGPFTVTIEFSEWVTGFTADDISISSGLTKGTLEQADAYHYTIELTPTSDGMKTVNVYADVAIGGTSAKGNQAAAQFQITTDVTAPTVNSVSVPSNGTYTVGQNLDFTVNTSENVTVNTTGGTPYIALTIGYTGNLRASYISGSGSSELLFRYTVQSGNTDIDGIAVSTLKTNGGTLQDDAGNDMTLTLNSIGSTSSVLVDTTAPTVEVTGAPATTNGAAAFNVTITFSEEVTGFALGDITVGNGAASNLSGSGTTYTADITPDGQGDVTIDVAEAVAQDAASNDNTAATQAVVTYDADAPTVTFSPSDSATGVAANSNITITFNEAVRLIDDTALSDTNVDALITLKDTNASGSDIGFDATIDADKKVITINPTSDFSSSQEVYVAIGATVEDRAGNAISASNATFTAADTTAPTVTITGPSGNVTDDFTATFTFSESVTGFVASDVTVTNGSKGTFSGSGDSYTLVITPELGSTVSVSVAEAAAADAAGNDNTASNTLEVQAGSVQSAFDTNQTQIKQAIVDDATRSLQSAVSSNIRMIQDARGRFMEGALNYDMPSRNSVPFDVDGSAQVSDGVLSTSGSFFGQRGAFDGTERRLVFGDFDVQHDSATGSTTATLSGKVAWEWMASETTMLGYFLGGELAKSDLSGTFTGEQERVAVSVGGYVVHELRENLYADGFVSLGMGTNNLDMANDVLTLASDYTTRSATLGGSLSGVVAQEGFELRPELAFSYGKTWIGNVGFTGWAYGLVDNTLSLDAGNVSIANLTFRPEVVIPMDATSTASFAPRLICEQVKTTTTQENCGGGAEFGLQSTSEDGLSNLTAKVIADRVGNSTRTSLQMNFERRF